MVAAAHFVLAPADLWRFVIQHDRLVLGSSRGLSNCHRWHRWAREEESCQRVPSGSGGGRTCDRCDGPCGRRCRNTVEEWARPASNLVPSRSRRNCSRCLTRRCACPQGASTTGAPKHAHAGRGHSRTEVETDTSEDETSASVKAGGAAADVRPQGWVLARTCSAQGNLNQLVGLQFPVTSHSHNHSSTMNGARQRPISVAITATTSSGSWTTLQGWLNQGGNLSGGDASLVGSEI